MVKKPMPSRKDDDLAPAIGLSGGAKKKKKKGSPPPRFGNIMITAGVAGALVSVGVWVAAEFWHINIPAQLAPPLTTIVTWLSYVGRAIIIVLMEIWNL
jgi:hypothetical protein